MILMHVFEFMQLHRTWMVFATISTLVLSGLSFGVACLIMVRLPATYFSDPRQPAEKMHAQTALHGVKTALRNLCGSLIVLFGTVLAIPGIPGPGIMIALLGLMLMDFSAKRQLEWLLVRSSGAFALINRLRQRCGRSPFISQKS